MGGIADTEFFGLIHDFFMNYLPNQRRCSEHTIRAYRTSLDAFIDFVKKKHDIKLSDVTFDMLDSVALEEFLDGIEDKGDSILTRNHRLACIRSFYSYAAQISSAAVIHMADISKLPVKRPADTETIEYMSETAIKALLEQPSPLVKKGMRDRFIMVLMYDTAARIQEIIDVKLCDIKLSKTPVITLHGKGSKTRQVPLMKQTICHFETYCKVFHPNVEDYSDQPLFYTMHHGQKNPMEVSTVRKLIGGYGEEARKRCMEVPHGVHPHMLRHSRALHLYQHGMDLTLVSQWLGHSQLETTLIYAFADTEAKRRAIETATPADSPLKKKLNADRYSVTDEDTLKRLYGLK